jgi:hypothetical protein
MFRAQHCVLGRLSSHSLREFGSFRRRLQRVSNLQGKLAPRVALRRRLRSHRRRRRLRSRRRRRLQRVGNLQGKLAPRAALRRRLRSHRRRRRLRSRRRRRRRLQRLDGPEKMSLKRGDV